MPNRRPTRGATAGRSPATAEADIPTLGTFHAAGNSLDGGARQGAGCRPRAADRAFPATRNPQPKRVYSPRRTRASPAGAPRGAGCGRPAAWNVPSVGVYASAVAGLRPAGAPRVGLRGGMGYTFSHPMDAAPRQPLGAARQARALRLQDRLASLASCEPQAPVWTRLRPSGSACGAWSLRSRSAGRGRRVARSVLVERVPVGLEQRDRLVVGPAVRSGPARARRAHRAPPARP